MQPTLMLLCFPLLAGWVTMGLAPLDKVLNNISEDFSIQARSCSHCDTEYQIKIRIRNIKYYVFQNIRSLAGIRFLHCKSSPRPGSDVLSNSGKEPTFILIRDPSVFSIEKKIIIVVFFYRQKNIL